ncbi:hypothetical protein Hanom_Chr03g00229291 [Helianthus anomalus]
MPKPKYFEAWVLRLQINRVSNLKKKVCMIFGLDYTKNRVNCSDGPCGFTFSPHLLKIACMLPMVCILLLG